jgi:hypothetical protein
MSQVLRKRRLILCSGGIKKLQVPQMCGVARIAASTRGRLKNNCVDAMETGRVTMING